MLNICYTLLAGKTIHVYTRFSTLEWVFNSKALYARSVSFAVLLSPFHLKVKRVRERVMEFVQLLQASVTPHIGFDESLSHVAPPSKNSATVRLDPELLYAHVPRDFVGYVLSFDGSAKTEKNGGYGSCSWIRWRLPDWNIEIAASAYLSSTTVNNAEYTGMNNGVKAAVDRGVRDLIVIGDSRLAIQKSMGVIACKKYSLQVELAHHKELTSKLNLVRYLHVVRYYNAAADSLATEALECKAGRVVLSGDGKTELKTLNRISEVLYAEPNPAENVDRSHSNDAEPDTPSPLRRSNRVGSGRGSDAELSRHQPAASV
jgi:ribonuclease HI